MIIAIHNNTHIALIVKSMNQLFLFAFGVHIYVIVSPLLLMEY